MKHLILAAALAVFPMFGILASGTPALAQEFSAGSKAKGWKNLVGREPATFDAKVTDAICALTDDCPADCGAGKRQMVLIREADGKMILAAKNTQAGFQGGTWDLAPLCGKTVRVDGLLVGNDPNLGSKLYQLQLIGAGGSGLKKADGFTAPWNARNPNAGGKGPWFRRDPHVQKRIDATGFLGLGLETDAIFLEEEYGE